MSTIIETALKSLDAYLKTTNWYGRENEVVNLFAHSFLAKYVPVSRIGIEVSVKQLSGPDRKALVRKDLVIWGKAAGTVWNGKREPVNEPLAVIEWKVNSAAKCAADIKWLKGFTKAHPGVAGYGVCAFINGDKAGRAGTAGGGSGAFILGKRGVEYVKIRKGEEQSI